MIILFADNLPWVEIRNYGNCNYFLLDVVIIKMSQDVGLYFKQNFIEEKDEVSIQGPKNKKIQPRKSKKNYFPNF